MKKVYYPNSNIPNDVHMHILLNHSELEQHIFCLKYIIAKLYRNFHVKLSHRGHIHLNIIKISTSPFPYLMHFFDVSTSTSQAGDNLRCYNK